MSYADAERSAFAIGDQDITRSVAYVREILFVGQIFDVKIHVKAIF